jgi:hypothetical protein
MPGAVVEGRSDADGAALVATPRLHPAPPSPASPELDASPIAASPDVPPSRGDTDVDEALTVELDDPPLAELDDPPLSGAASMTMSSRDPHPQTTAHATMVDVRARPALRMRW